MIGLKVLATVAVLICAAILFLGTMDRTASDETVSAIDAFWRDCAIHVLGVFGSMGAIWI